MRRCLLSGLVCALIVAASPRALDAKAGYFSVASGLTASVGSTQYFELALASFVPSVGVFGAPDPHVDWGDGTGDTMTVGFPCKLGFSCRLSASHTYQAVGTYKVTLKYYNGCCVSYDADLEIKVFPPSFIMAIVGDSVASGEGVPEHNLGTDINDPMWVDSHCHRSRKSGFYQAAKLIEAENGVGVPIDDYFLACSGADTGDIKKQITNLPAGPVDALVISAGANDLPGGFGHVVNKCLQINDPGLKLEFDNVYTNCAADDDFTSAVSSAISDLPSGYTKIREAIDARAVSSVFLTEYFDPTRNDDGDFSNGAGDVCTLSFHVMKSSEWQWLYDGVVAPLNTAVHTAACQNGNPGSEVCFADPGHAPWYAVGDIASAFKTHGFCAWTPHQKNWVVALAPDSVEIQGDLHGEAHPNEDGHKKYAERIRDTIYRETRPLTVAQAFVKGRSEPLDVGQTPTFDVTSTSIALQPVNKLSKSGVGRVLYAVDDDAHACTNATPDGCRVYQKFVGITVDGPGLHTVTFFAENSFGIFEDLKTVSFVLQDFNFITLTANGAPYVPGAWTRYNVDLQLAGGFHGPGSNPISACVDGQCTTLDGVMTIAADGSHDVTVTDGSISSPSTFNYHFKVNIDRTPPVMTLFQRTAANAAGWNNTPVRVEWSCSDDESGVAATFVSDTVSVDGVNLSAAATCRNGAGDAVSAQLAGINIDRTRPTVSAIADRAPDANGWYRQAISVTWSGTDDRSGIVSCSPRRTYSGPDTAGVTLTATCEDRAGNVGDGVFQLKYDATPPVIALVSRTPAANALGWNRSDVTLQWSCVDALSGATAPGASTMISAEGANLTATGRCSDLAGNVSSDTQSGINIDKTAPAIRCLASPSVLWPPNHKLVPISTSVVVTDALSGPNGFLLTDRRSSDGNEEVDMPNWTVGKPITTGALRAERAGSSDGRTYQLLYQAQDAAGNLAACTVGVTVPHDQR